MMSFTHVYSSPVPTRVMSHICLGLSRDMTSLARAYIFSPFVCLVSKARHVMSKARASRQYHVFWCVCDESYLFRLLVTCSIYVHHC